MARTVTMVAVVAGLIPHAADAKTFLECVGASQHRCLGKFGCLYGDPLCQPCEAGAECKKADTCFEHERFNVIIDGDTAEVATFKYKVETHHDSYGFVPVDPNAFGQWHKDDQLTINRLTGAYKWWPATPIRPDWHYEEGNPDLESEQGCHVNNPRF